MPIFSSYWLPDEAAYAKEPRQDGPLRAFPELLRANPRASIAAEEDFAPLFEIRETSSGYSIVATMPGINRANTVVNVTRQLVTISGTVQPRLPMTHEARSGIGRAKFKCTFVIPPGIDARRTKTEFNAGTLEVELPLRRDLSHGPAVAGCVLETLKVQSAAPSRAPSGEPGR